MQIYKCMKNRYIDKHGSIREYVGFIHQKKMSTNEKEDCFFNVNDLIEKTNGGQYIQLPENPKQYQYYKLVYDLINVSEDGLTIYEVPINLRLEEYSE